MSDEETKQSARNKNNNDNNNSKPTVKWDDVKRARNRINSQRTRERERTQIHSLEAERTRLWLSNDALKYQNSHFREAIRQIHEIQNARQQFRAGSPGKTSSSSAATQQHKQQQQLVSTRSLDISDTDRALYAAGLNVGLGGTTAGFSSIHHQLGSQPTSLDVHTTSLFAQRQAALEMQSLMQQHQQRLGLGSSLSTLPQMHQQIQSRLTMLHPSLLDHQRLGGILPSDILELRVRRQQQQQQRLHNLGGGAAGLDNMTIGYPRGVPIPNNATTSMNDPSLLYELEEERKNDQSGMNKRQKYGF
jgi:hypothetical protein